MEPEKILIVDDEPNILDSFKRQLRGHFHLDTSTCAERALKRLNQDGPFAVVVTDMQMPGIDGLAFLEMLKKKSPHTIRVMLTGCREQEIAAKALNEGGIFRFLLKPCSTEQMIDTLMSALQQYRFAQAERDLLQNTLCGSIKLLTDVLSMIDSETFGRSLKIRNFARKVAQELGLPDKWELELGSMLALIGWVTLPAEVSKKSRAGIELTEAEQVMIATIPSIGARLVRNIPRLEELANIIAYSGKNFDGSGEPKDACAGEGIPLNSRVLHILKDAVEGLESGKSLQSVFGEMIRARGIYDPQLLNSIFQLLRSGDSPADESDPKPTNVLETRVGKLRPGQHLAADVVSMDGSVLAPAGLIVSEALIETLLNFATYVGVKEPILIENEVFVKSEPGVIG